MRNQIMQMKRKSALVAGLVLGLSAATTMAAPVFQLSDVKLDGTVDENTFAFGGGTGSVSYASDSLSVTYASNQYGYFTSYFPTQTLADTGDKLVMNFTLSLSKLSANDQTFRFGLFNSNGTKASANGFENGANLAFGNDRGYAPMYRQSGASTVSDAIYERVDGDSNNLFGTAAFAAVSGSPQLNNLNLTTSAFSGTLTLEKTAAGVLITTNVNGVGNQSVTDPAALLPSPFTSFDTLGIFAFTNSSAGAATMNVTALSVNFIPIPEPATLGTLGVAAVGLLSRRRQRC